MEMDLAGKFKSESIELYFCKFKKKKNIKYELKIIFSLFKFRQLSCQMHPQLDTCVIKQVSN